MFLQWPYPVISLPLLPSGNLYQVWGNVSRQYTSPVILGVMCVCACVRVQNAFLEVTFPFPSFPRVTKQNIKGCPHRKNGGTPPRTYFHIQYITGSPSYEIWNSYLISNAQFSRKEDTKVGRKTELWVEGPYKMTVCRPQKNCVRLPKSQLIKNRISLDCESSNSSFRTRTPGHPCSYGVRTR